MKFIFSIVFLAIVFSYASAQQQSFTDPAQQYNRLLIENNSGKYYQIQNFKVIGTPYLYGGGNDGKVYTAKQSEGNINYNTFNQQVECVTEGKAAPEILDINSADSFLITVKTDMFNGELKFVNASKWNFKNKFFIQEVAKMVNYTLYKKFFSSLEIVTTNYIQSDLRQFQLNFEYYYLENNKLELKKLKTTENGLKSEFSTKKNCIGNFDFSTITYEKENVLKSFFQVLDTCK